VVITNEATAQPVPIDVDATLVCREANRSPDVVPHVSPAVAEKLKQKELKRIRDARLRCDELKRAEAERFEAAKREYEAQRRIEEAKRKEYMERLRKFEDERRAAAAAEAEEMRKPINRLRRAYSQYIYVRSCYRVRQGYLAVWINDVEMERARGAVTRIENEVLTEEPTINTAAMWKEFSDRKPATVYEAECKPTYHALLEAAPSLPDIKDFGR
jgi:hypothetical protein